MTHERSEVDVGDLPPTQRHRVTVEARSPEGDWIPVIYRAECETVRIDTNNIFAGEGEDVEVVARYFVLCAHGEGEVERIDRPEA